MISIAKPLGFGFVGCVESSEAQARALRSVEGAAVRGFCDSSRPRAEARAALFGGKAYTRVQDLADDPNIDVISVCTPFGLHMEAAITAAAAHKHVLVDEPLEVTLERLDHIVVACREHRVRLGAMLPRRFLPAARALKTAVSTGRFGRPVHASVFMTWAGPPASFVPSSWLEGGGLLLNQGFQGVDLLQWLLGPVSQVSAFPARRAQGRLEEVLGMTLQFRSGAFGVVEATSGQSQAPALVLDLRGTRGAAVLTNDRITHWEQGDASAVEELFESDRPRSTASALDEGTRRQLQDFVAAVKENRKPWVDGVEARPVLAIIQAAYRSAREGHVVELEES